MAYVLRLEELRQEASSAQLAAVLARASGTDAHIPVWDEVRADFDRVLCAVPEQVADPAKYELMQALGLR